MFGHQRLGAEVYPRANRFRWSPEIEKDFSQWLNAYIDKLPVPREQIKST
jgi:hypothetical protein